MEIKRSLGLSPWSISLAAELDYFSVLWFAQVWRFGDVFLLECCMFIGGGRIRERTDNMGRLVGRRKLREMRM
jgi:hypothetical protein